MKVLKYGTGHEVPNDAIYLTTVVELFKGNRFVWHYFIIMEKKE